MHTKVLHHVAAICVLVGGGSLQAAHCSAQTPPTGAGPIGSIVGIVWDSTRGGPLADANITLVNTSVTAQSNGDGRFFIPNLAPGRYLISFTHPRLDSLGYAPAPVDVSVSAESAAPVQLAIPLAASTGPGNSLVDDAASLLKEMGVRVDSSLKSRIRESSGDASDLLGLVVEESNGRPIAGVMVTFEGTRFNALSDREGRFAFRGIPPKSYTLKVTMLGYAERREQVQIAAGKLLDLRVDLSPKAIELPPLVVEARSLGLERSGFYQRRNDRGTWGKFFTSSDLERKNLFEVADLFYSVQGARVINMGMGKRVVQFNRADGSGGGCVPPIYVDGMRLPNALDYLSPQWIDGIEVYVGNNAPIEYAGFASCGVILVWTRRSK